MRIARIFPRRTKMTPTDDMAFIGEPTLFTPEIDRAEISVTFDWDLPRAEWLASAWKVRAPVLLGGPALGDPGGEFEPGRYVALGNVITSRGCPNACWFCRAWRNEGHNVRTLPIKDGYNVLDNNLLACSREHQAAVFDMLARQKERPRFTGGLEAHRFTDWHAHGLALLKPSVMWFAYDLPTDGPAVVAAADTCHAAGLLTRHRVGCYVLAGWRNEPGAPPPDTVDNADQRAWFVAALGLFPQVMLYNDGRNWPPEDRARWKAWSTHWVNKISVGGRMKVAAQRARKVMAEVKPPKEG